MEVLSSDLAPAVGEPPGDVAGARVERERADALGGAEDHEGLPLASEIELPAGQPVVPVRTRGAEEQRAGHQRQDLCEEFTKLAETRLAQNTLTL